jgi:F0F1-type ATP synthase assembly protein I
MLKKVQFRKEKRKEDKKNILIDRKESNKQLMQYAGLAMQFLVSIALGVFIGMKCDEWLNISFPLLVWLLPLLMIIGIIVKIIKDTSKK